MIIVQLVGGLGNQLFQYAAGRRLAHSHNTILKLDLSAYKKYTLHAYHLNFFNIIENIASADDIAGISGAAARSSDGRRQAVVRERFFHFDPGILELPDNILMIGYWQNENYFADIKEIILKELTLKNNLDFRNQKIAQAMENCNSVALHVRRADYVNNAQTNRIHGTCGLDYYKICTAKLAEQVKELHYYVFSDDPKWVKENFNFLKHPVTYIDFNGPEKDYVDLWLMTRCKHNIIANSTFSWWGAWLNRNPGKIVFAPFKWFNKPANTRELIPASWIRA